MKINWSILKSVRSLSLSYWVFAAVFLITRFSLAQESTSIPEHRLMPRFPDSEVTSLEFVEDTNYRLILSSLQRARGLVSSENSEMLRGDITKIIYEIAPEFTGQDVFEYFNNEAEEKNYRKLFSCIGRECGSSNYWANDIFGNRILYGPERNQYYSVFDAANEGREDFIAMYIITRGNRRVYAYFEFIEPGGAQSRIDIFDSDALLSELQAQRSIVLKNIDFESDLSLTSDSDISFLVSLLEKNPSLKFYLVAHLYQEGGESEELIARSRQRANVLRQVLLGRGIDREQIQAHGVGPFAPYCGAERCADRVELVMQ